MSELKTEFNILEKNERETAQSLVDLYKKATEGHHDEGWRAISDALAVKYLSSLLKDIRLESFHFDIKRAIEGINSVNISSPSRLIKGEHVDGLGEVKAGPEMRGKLIDRATYYQQATEIIDQSKTVDPLNLILEVVGALDYSLNDGQTESYKHAVRFAKISEKQIYSYNDNQAVVSTLDQMLLPVIERKKSELREKNELAAKMDNEIPFPNVTYQSIVDSVVGPMQIAIEYSVITFPVKYLKRLTQEKLLKTNFSKDIVKTLISSFKGAGLLKQGVHVAENQEFFDEATAYLEESIILDPTDLAYLIKHEYSARDAFSRLYKPQRQQ